jgi:hypothetical protein
MKGRGGVGKIIQYGFKFATNEEKEALKNFRLMKAIRVAKKQNKNARNRFFAFVHKNLLGGNNEDKDKA